MSYGILLEMLALYKEPVSTYTSILGILDALSMNKRKNLEKGVKKMQSKRNRRRQKKKTDEHIDETWLIPYSDMLTLLFALFIVLFAMSSIDAEKFKQMAVAFRSELVGRTGNKEFLSNQKPNEKKELSASSLEAEQAKQQEDRAKEMDELKALQKN